MRRLLGIIVPAFLLVATAQARIGETEAEIRARYGDPIGILPSSVEASLTNHYLSGGFSIAVTYVDGRSAREMLAKADKSKITDKEIRLLLDANAGGYSWNAQQLDSQKTRRQACWYGGLMTNARASPSTIRGPRRFLSPLSASST